ncbi:hypothetical protein VE03_03315 [Pseudogymnoascus sp. 23342-1-I1]|nr:hypothetical protein VE03_03315 [Pseudogymnoascus sp. 23342-1-I1]
MASKMLYSTIALSLILLDAQAYAACYDPSPAFLSPKSNTYRGSPVLNGAFEDITASLGKLVERPEFDTSSFSIEVTTSTHSLWELHHTAREKDPVRPGAEKVGGDSVYRIASITKAFTTLAIIQQHAAGNLSIDDTIEQYLNLRGDIQWSDITLRTIASQLSGIPRDFAMSDILYGVPDPLALGLPPVTDVGVPRCDSPCSGDDLLENLATRQPMWSPKQKSTYSNINFDLLGLVIENVTGLGYGEYVEGAILRPLGMDSSSFIKSDDSVAVLPKGQNYWDIEQGVQRPTGGLYCTSNDMSKFLRHVLTIHNTLSPQVNWFNPGSYSESLTSFYGMPWEIYRTSSILPSTLRPITFITKAGGLPGYSTYIIMAPDHGLGITIFTAGPPDLLDLIREAVTVPLLRAAEETAQQDLHDRYTGSFAAAAPLNSTIVLAQSDSKGLYIESFISNSTVTLDAWQGPLSPLTQGRPFRIQLVPSLLYREDGAGRKGEVWRGLVVLEERGGGAWDDHCSTNYDPLSYADKPLLEVVFWEGEGGVMEELEMVGLRVSLARVEGGGADSEAVGVARDGLKNENGQKVLK